ncbi:hypothetical protein [Sphingomonas sp. 3-13AW]|uniref:hypothetical protein n=1 Tax=Sphingomonas sp. 3-13AW TaxID=3050450 RepID=UPI003BB4D8C1
MNRTNPPWMSPPAIVQPLTRPSRDERLYETFKDAFEHAISVVGIDGLKRTSMFPSSSRRLAENHERQGAVRPDNDDGAS